MAKVNLVLDASQLNLFQVCEARFDYRYNHNKDEVSHVRFSKDDEQVGHPLDKGIIIHAGLAEYYRCLQQQRPFNIAIQQSLKAAHLKIAETDLPDSEVRFLLDTLMENIHYWRVEDQRIEILAVENPFSYMLYEDDDVRMIMTGVIDLIFNQSDGSRRVRDHKTYSRDTELVELDNQFENYCVATDTFILEVNRIGLQKTLDDKDRYKRPVLSYDLDILNEWKENTIQWLFRYMECVASGRWLLNLTSCNKFNRKCEYLPICRSSGKESKEFKLQTQFKTIEPWDVTKVLVPVGDHQK